MKEVPFLAVIENDIDERAVFLTAESVEYLCGLQIYAYFGVLAALAETFNERNSFLQLVSIISESPLLFVALIPESYVESFLSNLRKLADDLKTLLRVSLRRIDIPNRKISDPSVHEIRQSQVVHSSPWISCAYCRDPVSAADVVDWFDRKICFNCYQLAVAYKYLMKDTVVSLVKGKSNEGLTYKSLNVSLILGASSNAIAKRLLNPLSDQVVLQEGVIPTEMVIDRFNKKLGFWVLFDTELLINASLNAEANRIHKYATRCLLVPIVMKRVISENTSGAYVLVKCDPTSTVVQVQDEIDALRLAFAAIGEGANCAVVKAGSPGATYRKLFAKENAHRNRSEPFIYLDYVDCLMLGQDTKKAREISRSFKSLGLDLRRLEIVLNEVLTSLDMIRGDQNAVQDEVEKMLLKSELMLKIGSLTRMSLSTGLPGISDGYGKVFVEEMMKVYEDNPARLLGMVSAMVYFLRSGGGVTL